MVRLNYSQSLATQHVSAVIDRIGKTYDESAILGYIEKLGIKSIEEFLLADVNTMREWVKSFPELLCFTGRMNRVLEKFYKFLLVTIDKNHQLNNPWPVKLPVRGVKATIPILKNHPPAVYTTVLLI